MAPWITAAEIIKYHETKSAEYFANFVLGLPYVGEGNQVTPDIIYRNCTPDINAQERVVIGCDSGLKKHYVLGNKDGIFYAGIAQDWSEIDSLLKKYERSVAVIDALPDLTEPRRLREKYPGRVFLCHYARDRKTMQIVRWGKGEELGNVVVDRNRGLQMVIDDFAAKKIPLQGTQDDWAEYQSHWDTLYKVTTLDTLGVPTFSWESSNGLDHFCHATLYWRVGMDRFKNDGGKIFTGEIAEFPTSSYIRPDDTMPYKPKFAYPNQEPVQDWRTT
jgi:hypothetical protein